MNDNEKVFGRELLRRLIVVAIVLVAAIALYFVASPYQNCLKETGRNDYERPDPEFARNITVRQCLDATSW